MNFSTNHLCNSIVDDNKIKLPYCHLLFRKKKRHNNIADDAAADDDDDEDNDNNDDDDVFLFLIDLSSNINKFYFNFYILPTSPLQLFPCPSA